MLWYLKNEKIARDNMKKDLVIKMNNLMDFFEMHVDISIM